MPGLLYMKKFYKFLYLPFYILTASLGHSYSFSHKIVRILFPLGTASQRSLLY